MNLRPLAEAEVRALGERLHLDLTTDEVAGFRALIEWTLPVYESVDAYGQPSNRAGVERTIDTGVRQHSKDVQPGSPGVTSEPATTVRSPDSTSASRTTSRSPAWR